MILRIALSHRLTVFLSFAVVLGLGWALTAEIGGIHGQEDVQFTDYSLLLTTNRDRLAVCVESLSPNNIGNQQIQGKIRGALNKIRVQHPDYGAAGLGPAPVDVSIDCPGGPTIFEPDYDISESRGGTPHRRTLNEVSEYRTFIYIATDEQIAQAFQDITRYPRRLPREVVCEDSPHTCLSVTTALYLTPNELHDRDFLERSLMHGIGLWPVDEAREGIQYPIDPRGK